MLKCRQHCIIKSLVLSFLLFVWWGCLEASATTYNSDQLAIQAAGYDFAAIGIEKSFSSLPTGFVRQEDIVAGPGVRLPHYAKSYGDNEYDYAFISAGIFNGKIAFKLFQMVQNDKTHCMNTTVKSVEHLQKIGINNWKKYWRKDYQVAQWKALVGKYKFSVTCRMKEGVWLLEETRGLAVIK